MQVVLVDAARRPVVARRVPAESPPEPELVAVHRVAHQADLGDVRPGTAVGAAGHAHRRDGVVDAELVEAPPGGRRRRPAIARSASVTASPQVGSAGQAIASRGAARGSRRPARTPWPSRIAVDDARAARRDVDQVQVLVGRDPEGDAVVRGDLPERGPQVDRRPSSRTRPFSTRRPRNQRPSPWGCQPSRSSARVPGDRRAGPRASPATSSTCVAEPVDAAVVDEVLEPGVPAVGAVAVVALDDDHALGDAQQVVRLHEAKRVGQAREGLGLAVGPAQAAAHVDVPAQRARRRRGPPARPRSWVNRSTELSPATVTQVLNLRGR